MSDFNGGQSNVSMEDVEAFLASQFQRPTFQPGVGAPPPTGGVEPPSGTPAGQFSASDIPADDPSTVPPTTLPTDEGEGIGDEEDDDESEDEEDDELAQLSPEQLRAYAQLDTIFRNDPNLQHILSAYLRGEDITPFIKRETPGGDGESSPPVTATGPNTPVSPGPLSTPTTAPTIDPQWLDDPVYRSLYDQQQRTLQHLEELQRATQTQQSIIHRQQESNTAAIVTRATRSFQQQHELSDEEINGLRNVAAKLNVVNSFMTGIDPVTGAPVQPDPLMAVERALEIAMYADPKLRLKELQRLSAQDNADSQRKKKLGAIAGSSGSVPRSNPAPTTKEERRESMVREVADMLQGSWTPE